MIKHTPGPYLVDGRTVYALDESGQVNRMSFNVHGGAVEAEGTRTTPEEMEATAVFAAKAMNNFEDLRAAAIVGLYLLNALPRRLINGVDSYELAQRVTNLIEETK